MEKIAIVVVAYNRVNSLSRLLYSLNDAVYGQEVTLIISIDNSGNNQVLEYSKSFEWSHGDKRIIRHPQRLGLRKHVISCGNLTNIYDAVIVLEDDIFVSKYFFSYVVKTVNKYDKCDSIAGISLYKHQWNVGINRPFVPLDNGYDVFFIKYAQSWGQVWTRRMWSQFYKWYLDNEGKIDQVAGLPKYVLNWPESSWLKYHIGFVVDTNRYFVYPHISLSTNFTDSGTHNKVSTTNFQVPILSHDKSVYKLPEIDEKALKYDVFFEIENLDNFLILEKRKENICIDLYGVKNNFEKKRYWLTTIPSNFKLIENFSLQLQPHELNIIYNLNGSGIFLYDTHYEEGRFTKSQIEDLTVSKVRYDVKAISTRRLFALLKYELFQSIKRRMKSIFVKDKM